MNYIRKISVELDKYERQINVNDLQQAFRYCSSKYLKNNLKKYRTKYVAPAEDFAPHFAIGCILFL